MRQLRVRVLRNRVNSIEIFYTVDHNIMVIVMVIRGSNSRSGLNQFRFKTAHPEHDYRHAKKSLGLIHWIKVMQFCATFY